MTTAAPPDRPRRPEPEPDERRQRLEPAGSDDDDQPDFSAEFDHPSGRLDEVSLWES